MKNRLKKLLLTSLVGIVLVGCNGSKPPSSESSSENSSEASSEISSEISSENGSNKVVFDYRKDRDYSPAPVPSNEVDEDKLPSLESISGKIITLSDGVKTMVSGKYRLEFVNNSNKYNIRLVDLGTTNENEIVTNQNMVMGVVTNPVKLYLKGSGQAISTSYDSVEATSYGYKAIANIISTAGSVIQVSDLYYFASEDEEGAFNVRQVVKVISASASDTGFASEYTLGSAHSDALEWFVPNNIFKTFSGSNKIYRETLLGAPMMMMRNKNKGHTLSLSRYQPVIHYENDSYATLELHNTKKEITVAYPSNEANRKYHAMSNGTQHVYDLSIRAETTESYEKAAASVYNAHFNLQNTRIVNTDIDEVYKVINEDYKVFLHATEQENEDTGKKYTSYGLPWRITIEDGEFGPLTYQAGFIGQQIPSAYNMMLYGLMNDDLTSLQNGINVIDFWVEDAEFMSIAGVPHIWYDTWDDGFRAYPCFLRMAVDAMEGLLDAYRLALAHGIFKYTWYDAIESFANFLVYNQNEDGSYYRCYNYSGGPFVSWDDGIEEPEGNICQSYSKSSSPMPVRFLGKMYELTEDESYKEAALRAGEYVYDNLYLSGVYQGGTCDNPNAVDKEAGVYAMYCYDALYMLTGEAKWLECLQQAAAFTMSTVMIHSFPVKQSNLKSAKALYSAYSDGMSFITCGSGGVDNYIAYTYYELFRIYILTGNEDYLRQAEFIQQNTKSIMNWDGTLGYKYKSLVAEASTIYTFNYSSASDGAWVTWSSVANAEPIAKMYTNFGNADVATYKDEDITTLQNRINEIGCGGKDHLVYENSVATQVQE